MLRKKKEVEVIDRGGAKTVEKKASFIKRVKSFYFLFVIVWLAFVVWFPLHIKAKYSTSIKNSIVVSLFYDMQHSVVEQYQKLLDGIKKSINLEKPIGVAIDKVKIVEKQVAKVSDATAGAKQTTAKASETTSSVKKLTGIVNKFGIGTGAVDKAVDQADKAIDTANKAVDKVDNTAKMVNEKLDKVEKELTKVAQIEVDKMIDEAIKNQIDKNTGGLGTTLLTDYGIQHVYPWRPSTWPVANRIYNNLKKSNLGVIQILTRTVDSYFVYISWGLVIAAWAAGLYLWLMVHKKYKAIIAPFIVCPRCGHTIADRRTAMSLLSVLQPWKWF